MEDQSCIRGKTSSEEEKGKGGDFIIRRKS